MEKTNKMNFCGQASLGLPVSALTAMVGASQGSSSSSEPIFGDIEFPQSVGKRPFAEDYMTNFLINAPCPSRKRPRVTKKSVRFSDDKANIPRTVRQEDLSTVWYKRADYKGFREDSHSLTLAFELGILDRIHPDEFCLRGLEASLSSAHLEARMTARATMLECILRTQEAQKGHGMKDDEMIRGLSLVLSKDASEDALKLAAYDQAEAQEVMREGTSAN